ncbi:protein MODIFIED TRANSPORT TO THE VACUOLE 1 [Sesamum angolense]|uniref:Protein MODIFIED TRANSPORT TO THE VACUOLE 1 n=1 Tax=Sesamum angolense TaxID=2727404 RepID=A0AAE1XE39_9LAMI|nr:protein MODIFIED TRANSPORT TO THE VACUOLE 1 [Sesamum angolense]
MQQSRRAVESYCRSRLIDAATDEEDKVTPVYKLEEICNLLRSSHESAVKEVSGFILKRLEHKSPVVKQKLLDDLNAFSVIKLNRVRGLSKQISHCGMLAFPALRIIKYAVGKSGAEFRREMQRHSVAVRQLIHYKGQLDPLKGDALNKAVRETAQEALSLLFSSDDSAASTTESRLGSRIQGFGNTNYEMPSEDKKSFISEVVGIGSATIRQGLSSLRQSPSLRKTNDSGSYKVPNLRRSLTQETNFSDQYEGIDSPTETYDSSRFSNNAGSGTWGQHVNASQAETSGGDSGSTYGHKTREEKLLETIVIAGGVRLQPTRDALHIFLVEASKLNALSLGHAIETKLRSPQWQVLSLLGCEQSGEGNHVEESTEMSQPAVMPDLIDAGGANDLAGIEDSKKTQNEPKISDLAASTAPLIDDLLDGNFGGDVSSPLKSDDDPFADVSFHMRQDKDHAADVFSGMAVDKSGTMKSHIGTHTTESEPFYLFSSSSEVFQEHENPRKDISNLMDGLSINGNGPSIKKNESFAEKGSDALNSEITSQAAAVNANPMFPLDALAYNFPSGFMYNPGFASQPMNYSAMGSLLAQQQLLATMTTFQQLGNLQSSTINTTANSKGGNFSPLPSVFNPVIVTQPPTSMMNGSKERRLRHLILSRNILPQFMTRSVCDLSSLTAAVHH